MKRVYVTTMRAILAVLRAVGVLSILDRWARSSRRGLWVRSLLAIYDPSALSRLDVPWWTFEASDLVAHYLEETPDARVFEWGAGASTLWLARRAGTVLSIEHDAEWADTLSTMLPANARVTTVVPTPRTESTRVASAKPGFEHLDFSDYAAAIDDQDGLFDLIVIDGRAREACLARAMSRITPGGVIVFDNVDRQRYRDAIAALGGAVEVRWTRGLTPSLPYPTRTALLSPSKGPHA
jgi:hypothetical protein